MSEAAVAVAESGGSTILTGGPLGATPAAPSLNEPKIEPGAVGSGIAEAKELAARPEWMPEKYWDSEKRAPRVEDMAKGYTNLEKLLGREKIPVPANDDDAEGWQRWYEAAGVPKDETGYQLKRPDKLPDGLNYDDDLESSFRKAARANGLNNRQASSLYDQFVKHQVDRYGTWQADQQQAKTQVLGELHREYGNQFDAAMQQARLALDRFAGPEYRKYLDESGSGNDPRVIRAWVAVGKEMSGESKLKGEARAEGIMDAQRAISEFNAKYEDALFDRNHPDHALRVKERSKLFELAYPE